MLASQRVTLVRSICERLSEENMTDIDLTLDQFHIGPLALRGGSIDKYGYCVARVQTADDGTLIELGNHVLGSPEGAAAPEPLPWHPKRFRLFLSHLATEKHLVSAVKAELAACTVDAFVAHQDIEPAKLWQDQIELALQTCDALVALMTEGFHDSKWTDQEIGFCMSRRVLIVPVRLGVDPYGFIGRYQAVTPAKDAAAIAKAIFGVLVSHELTSAKIAPLLVEQFSGSQSYVDAMRNAGLMKSIVRWTPEHLREIEQALETNDQISRAYGVPEIVRAIVEKHRT
jgi:hypothetical protein